MLITIIAVLLIVIVVRIHVLWRRRQKRQLLLRELVERKRIEREESIIFARKCGEKIDAATREKISAMNFKQLRDALQTGNVSCIEVLRTYFHKSLEAHEKTNAICMYVKEAENWANDLDSKAKDQEYKKPPLFGIPISLKENVPLKGYDQTRGFVQDTFNPTEEDGVMVMNLKRLGAIPFCQTNVPQSLLSYMCSNPIYGKTNHPYDKNRTSGGSSGGESALISAGGSLLGIGGDVGGSIRVPCAFTGIVGFKPSHLRFSHRGVCGSVPGRPLINANEGPMALDVETNVEVLKCLWSDNFISEHDPYVPPVLWSQEQFASKRPLKIGYYINDGWFTPVPASQRAVIETKQLLEALGHTLVPFQPPNTWKMVKILLRAVCVDGGRFLFKKLSNDIVDKLLYQQVLLWMIPVFVQRAMSHIVKRFFPRLGHIMTAMTLSTLELRETYADIEEYRYEFTRLMMRENLDGLICPVAVMPAPEHSVPTKVLTALTYTAIFNMIDFAAGSVPVTKITQEDENKMEEDYKEDDMWYKIVKDTSRGAIGFPIGVQVATPPYKEETCLRIMSEIEQGLKRNL